MGIKLARKTFPSGHSATDFECFGPAAMKDGDFDDAMLVDMGCFKQDEVDSNKYYHGAVVQSKKDKRWYAYYEYARTGASNPEFQFESCDSKESAHAAFVKQVSSKNTGRGIWHTIAGRPTLIPKPSKSKAAKTKDLYLVRPTAKRTTGLPDAQKIIQDDSDVSKKPKKKTGKKTVKARFDTKTTALGRALIGGTINYTKSNLAGGHIPTQGAIDEGRDILAEAMRRVGKLGKATVKEQAKDKELRLLTQTMYGRIPKVKERGAAEETWLLTADNIQGWQLDLDAFEAALLAIDAGDTVLIDDPFEGMNLEMIWVDLATLEGEFVNNWMPKATANHHSHIGDMRILNMWALRQPSLVSRFDTRTKSIAADTIRKDRVKPKFQPRSRKDLQAAEKKIFTNANVAMLFHGTRSVNVTGILRTGLKLPRQLVGVAITGAMFGPGVYWADDWKKSDGYTSREGTYWARGGGDVKGRGAFMFIADVALGNPHVANSWSGYTKAPSGYHSVAGIAGRSGVQNNEWIVYDASQNNLRYLVEYEVGSRSRRY